MEDFHPIKNKHYVHLNIKDILVYLKKKLAHLPPIFCIFTIHFIWKELLQHQTSHCLKHWKKQRSRPLLPYTVHSS